jgi:hypothetical protein
MEIEENQDIRQINSHKIPIQFNNKFSVWSIHKISKLFLKTNLKFRK